MRICAVDGRDLYVVDGAGRAGVGLGYVAGAYEADVSSHGFRTIGKELNAEVTEVKARRALGDRRFDGNISGRRGLRCQSEGPSRLRVHNTVALHMG